MIPTHTEAGGKCKVSAFVTGARRHRHFAYLQPTSLEEAWALMTEHEGARLIAGGTDVMTGLKDGALRPSALISLRGIPELTGIEVNNQGARIGAMTTITEIVESQALAERYPVLVEGARCLGSLQVRNVATVGGNLGNASPCADTAPPLLVLDAAVRLRSAASARDVPLAEFFVGPGATALAPGEILTDILIPVPPAGARATFMNRGRVKLDITKVSVAVLLALEGKTCRLARVAAGSVGPTPLRLPAVEAILTGAALTDDRVAAAREAAAQAVVPITDIRSTEDYRRELTGVLLQRAIQALRTSNTGGAA
jgi:carbon-monoxide dehydrogenase medium subunit